MAFLSPSSTSCTIIFFIFLIYAVLQLEASHNNVYYEDDERRLQSQPSPGFSSSQDHQPYRTGYHFQPPKHWINGPMLYKGIYHLFYQYNPKGAVWGNIVWAHSTSTDLVNWIPHEIGIKPSIPSDINGCWSGSATMLPGHKPAILYTGINPLNQQVQNLAVPKNLSDPYLIEWTKVRSNPLMFPTLANKINSSSFRDPTTAWLLPDKKWRVIIGSKVNRRGKAILYHSKDFIHWVEAKQPLHSAEDTGMWECPDFYPVYKDKLAGAHTSTIGSEVKHVLKASLDDTKHEYYTIGTYDIQNDTYVPDKGSVEGDSGLRYDYGKYYASKTFFDDAKVRRILLGWVNESSSVEADIKKGWSGIHTIPRTVVLDKSGKQLVQWPIKELEKLRERPVYLSGKWIKQGAVHEVHGITAAQADVEVTFRVRELKDVEKFDTKWTNPQLLCSQKEATVKGGVGPFGLLTLASQGLEEYTAVFFRIFKAQDKYVVLMCSDQSRSSLDPTNDKTTYGTFVNVDPIHEGLTLRTLIDHSVVESFGAEGKNVITARVYPTMAIDHKARLYAFNYGAEGVEITRFNAWSMKKAHIN
ncbi:Fructan 6-exohydrolase [Dionaea muscipula]